MTARVNSLLGLPVTRCMRFHSSGYSGAADAPQLKAAGRQQARQGEDERKAKQVLKIQGRFLAIFSPGNMLTSLPGTIFMA